MRQPSGSHMMLLEHPARGSDSPRGSPRIGRSITDDVNVEGEEAFPPPKRERSRLRQLACVGVPAILGLVLLWITFRRTVCNGKCTPLWADFFCHDRIIARFAGTHFPGRQAGIVRDGKRIGVMGVVHPTVLGKFDIVNPCSVLELDLEPFVDIGM